MGRYAVVLPQCRFGLSTALAILAFALAPFAVAADGPGIALVIGLADSDYERDGLSLRFGPMWSADRGNWKASLRPELELSHFRYTGAGPGPDSLNQLGGIGRLHLLYGEGRLRPYAEAGLGVSLFSRDTLGSKDFSTHFQFSQHLALGVEFARRGSPACSIPTIPTPVSRSRTTASTCTRSWSALIFNRPRNRACPVAVELTNKGLCPE